jgi:hypothetical protein
MEKLVILDSLIAELNAINEIEDRRSLIYEDIINGSLKFKPLADQKPMLLFELLGGDITDIEKENYASPLDEEDYNEIYSEEEEDGDSENEDDDDDEEDEFESEDEYDEEEESIEYARNSGHWEVLGFCVLEGPGNIELPFTFEFCEGYLEGVKTTPYEAKYRSKGYKF